MDDYMIWFLVEAAILLGIIVRTVFPILRKRKAAEIIFEMKWLGTAVTAYVATRVTILAIIPVTLAVEFQVIVAFLIAFGENSILNELVKWMPLLPKRKPKVEKVLTAAEKLAQRKNSQP